MAVSVVMPALEMAQETGKLLSWLKKEGDAITKGEPLLEIETDKAVFELEAPGDGVLAGVISNAGDVVPVGRTVAWIVAAGESVPVESEPAAPSARAVIAPEASSRISPKARRIAQERGVDISTVRGTGPGGTITSEDVLAASVSPQETPATPTPEGLSSIARLMAERTTQSWTQTPHFFLVREVDAGALIEARKNVEARKAFDAAISITDLLIAIAARTVAQHPKMNASWSGGRIVLNPNVNLTLAVAVKDGVVGVVIKDADKIPLAELAALRKDLVERARAGRLRPVDIAGGTFTLSNLGMYGVDSFSAIITPPQAAILAVGRIADRVVPVNGEPGVRPMLTLTLSSDHRVADGAQAAAFLGRLADAIQEPVTR